MKHPFFPILCSFCLCLIGVAGGIYVLLAEAIPFAIGLSIALALIVIGSFGVYVWAKLKERETVYKWLFTAFVILAILSVAVVFLERTGAMELLTDRERLQEWIERTGAWAPVVYIILQFLQTVVLPIPTVVAIAVGVYLFGAFKCFLYSYIGGVTGSIVAFFIGRKLGYKVVSWLIGEETLQKWLSKVKGKDIFILTAMFLLPFFPDDVLCFVAGLSSMSSVYFIGMIMISRVISISTTAFPLDLIPFTTWWGILLWILIFSVVIVLMIIAYRNQERILSFLSKLKKHKEP